MKVERKDGESLDSLIRRFEKKVSGIRHEMNKNRYYKSPSDIRNEKNEKIKRLKRIEEKKRKEFRKRYKSMKRK